MVKACIKHSSTLGALQKNLEGANPEPSPSRIWKEVILEMFLFQIFSKRLSIIMLLIFITWQIEMLGGGVLFPSIKLANTASQPSTHLACFKGCVTQQRGSGHPTLLTQLAVSQNTNRDGSNYVHKHCHKCFWFVFSHHALRLPFWWCNTDNCGKFKGHYFSHMCS